MNNCRLQIFYYRNSGPKTGEILWRMPAANVAFGGQLEKVSPIFENNND